MTALAEIMWQRERRPELVGEMRTFIDWQRFTYIVLKAAMHNGMGFNDAGYLLRGDD